MGVAVMKHHQHAIGWREANRMYRADIVKEILALVACYAIAIALTAGSFYVVCHDLCR